MPIEREFKVGDYIHILNSGCLYSSWVEMFVKMGFKTNEYVQFNYNKDVIFQIFAREDYNDKHLRDYVYGVRNINDHKEYLFGSDDFCLVTKPINLDNSTPLSKLIDSNAVYKKEMEEILKKTFNSAIKSQQAKEYWLGSKSKYHK